MKHAWSTIHIPERSRKGDIKEVYIVNADDLGEFVQNHSINPDYEPVTMNPSMLLYLSNQALFIHQAMDQQSNLVIINEDERGEMSATGYQCTESRLEGTAYTGIGTAIVTRNPQGRLLMVQRGPRAKSHTGLWEFPGGALDLGEQVKAAAMREVLEEAGYHVHDAQLFSIDEYHGDSHWVNFNFAGQSDGKQVADFEQEIGKVSDIDWFDPNNLPALTPLAQTTINCYRKHLKQGGIIDGL